MSDKIVYAWYHNNEIFYVGIGNRRRRHKTTGRNQHCLNKRAKAKREGTFKISILFENLSWEQACQIEQELISEFGRKDNRTGILTNMTNGGEGNPGRTGSNLTEQGREKLRVAGKKRVWTKETRKKISQSLLKNNPKSRIISTPLGEFESCRQAASAHKVSHNAINYRVKSSNFTDYNYLDILAD